MKISTPGFNLISFRINNTTFYNNKKVVMKNWIQKSMLAGIAMLAINLFLLNSAMGQTYTWQGANNASWATSTNWTPTRTTPTATDVLQFNTGTTLNITLVPTQTIGRFVMSNNTNITLQATTGGVTLTIGNGAGTDLDVPSGSTLVVGGSNGLTVTLATSATANIGGTLTVNSGRTYNTNGTTVATTVGGTLNDAGTVTCTTASKLTFSNGSSYNYQENAGGAIPTSTWGASSNCNITGVTGTVPATASFAQAFGNFTWNCASQTADLSLIGNLTNVAGNFTVSATNTGSLRLSNAGVTATINIGGNLSQGAGEFYIGGTGGSNTWIVNVGGNFSLTGGTFDMADGGGSSTMNVDGNFTATGGSLTETNNATNTINFSGTGTQTYTSGATISNTINFNVNSGATLQMAAAATVVQGGGTFVVASGGTLGVTSTAGITTTGATGNIQSTGTRTYTTGSNYIYNGTGAQVAGNGLTQNTPANLTIDNPTSVTLSANTTISGNVLISQGTFSANNFDITLPGDWTNNGVTFTGGTGNNTFSGTTQAISGSASSSFGDIILNSGSVVTMSNSNSATSLTFNASATNSSFTHSGTAALTITGPVTINQPSGGTTFTTAWNINAGSATVSGLISTVGTNTAARITKIAITTGTLNANGGITLTGTTATNKVIDMSGAAATVNLKGTLTAATSTLTAGTNSTFNYNDNASAQTVAIFSAGGYNNLNINTTGGAGATLGAIVGATNVTGNLSVQSGTLSNGTFAITLAVNKNFSVSNGATFNLTGTTTMPAVSGTGTRTFGATSTVGYTGGAQTVTTETYGNLNLSGGTKTFSSGTTVIAGNIDITSATATLFAGTTSTAATISLGGNAQPSGSYGGTTSGTAFIIPTFFNTSTGKISVAGGSCVAGTWLGNISTDWNTGSNWCGGAVPTSSTNVIIPSGTPFAANVLTGVTAVCNNITINSGATLTLANSATALLNISGDLANNGTLTSGAAGKVSFVGTVAQAIGGSSTTSFTNLTISNSSAVVSVNTNINVSGTLSVGAGAVLTPAAAVVINNAAAAGTISGSGTVNVTRITATADYSNQYKFTTNTLTSLTVDYSGAGAQSISALTYGNLVTSNSGTKTMQGATVVGLNLTIGSGTTLDEAAITTSLSAGSVLTVNGTLNFSNSTGLIRTGTTGTSTLTMGAGGLIQTADDNGLGPVANASLQTQGTGVWDLTSVSTTGTVEYNRNVTSGQVVTDRDYNNLTITGTAQTKTWSIGATRTVNGTVTINGNFTLTNTQTINVLGDWTKTSGTFAAGTSTINFSGSNAQLINGATATTFTNLTVNKSAAANTVSSQTSAFTVSGGLTVTTGNLILLATNAGYTVGDLTVAANGTLTHNVDWATGMALSVSGNVAIDGAYSTGTAPRAHLTMTGAAKNVKIPNSAFSIFTIAAGASVTANGTVSANDNFWAPIGAGGSFNTGGQTINANASLLVSGGTMTITGGTVNVTGGLNIGQNGVAGAVAQTGGSVITDGITIGDGAVTAGSGTYTQSTGTTATVSGAVTINQQPGNATNAWNINAGTATVSGLITFAGTAANGNRIGTIVLSTGTLNANGGITFAGTANANKIINLGTTGTINMKGALTNATNATLTAGTSGSTFNYNDNTTAQTVNFFGAGAYNNLYINTTGGVGATLSAAISATNVTGDLRVQSGTLNNGGFAIVGNAARTLQVANGAFLQLAGTTSAFPTVFGTVSLGATSTVEYRGSGAQTIAAQNYGNLTTVLNGTRTITLANAGTIGIAGIFTPAGGTTSYTNTGSTVSFNGTTGSQNIPAFVFNILNINNTSGVVLTGNVNVNGGASALSFSNGKITTGSNAVILSATTTSTTAAAGKYIFGNQTNAIPTGTPGSTFYVGDATNYTPASLAFTTTITTGGNLTVNTTAGDNGSIGTSGLNASKSVNRFWTITNSGTAITPVGYSATFNFIGPTPGLGDIDAGATPANFIIKRLNGGTWFTTTNGTRLATSTNATAINGFGDFQIAEIACTAPVINTPAVTNISCNGSTDGAIDITTTGGSTPFTYAWTASNGFTAATEDITGLATGTYSLTITATGGCTVSSGSIAITQPAVLGATVNSTNVSCNGSSDGTITITSPTGGYGTYEYTINGGTNWQSGGSFTGLAAGTRNVKIRDAAHTACIVTLNGSLSITQPAILSATVTPTNISCNGAGDGSIVISSPTGGYGTYEYTINGGTNWQSGGSFTGLGVATYNVKIRDAAHTSCIITLNGALSITQPAVLNASVVSANITCNGSTDGTITITSPTGGYGTYEYTINGGTNWQSGGSFSGLSAGTYNVQVRDAAHTSCIVILNGALTISEPAVISANLSSTDVTCFAANDGTITFSSVAGGSGTYQYTINGGTNWQASGSFTGLAGGSYNVQIRDAAHTSCVVIFDLGLIINAPAVLSASVASTNLSCNGTSDGTISITSENGGYGTYEFTINGGTNWQSGGSFTGLAAGTYNVMIRDAAHTGCIITLNGALIITAPAVLSASVASSDVDCNGANNGSITITSPTGGYGNYEYSIDGGSNWQSSGSFTGLAAGTYNVQVRDADHTTCVITLNGALVISEPAVISANLSSTDVTCFAANDGTITFSSVAGGSGTYQYTINGGTNWQSSGSFTGLAGGSYNVQIRDAAHTSCVVIFDLGLIINAPDVLSASVASTNLSCNGTSDGTISITSEAGGYGTYEFTINGGTNWQSGGSFTGLAAGTYNVMIRDAAHTGCIITLNGALIITAPAVLNASVASSNVDCNGANNGSITITSPTGGYGNYEYSIDGGSNWQSSGSFTGLAAGTYNVQVRDADHTTCVITLNAALVISEPAVVNADHASTDATCGNIDGTITFTNPTGGSGTYEYTIDGGAHWQSSGNFTGLAAGSYDIRIRDAAHTSCVVILDASLVINQQGPPDAPTSGGNQTVCYNGDPEQTITASATGSGTITWYTAATGGTLVSPPSLTGVGTVTYYAQSTLGSCVSTRTAVTLTIQDAPLSPVSGGDQTVCYNGSPTQTLIATATSPATITWYDAATAGNIVSPPALIGIGTVTYYAEASNGTCASINRTPVTLTINAVLATPGAISGPLDVCPLVGSLTPSVYSIAAVPGAVSYTWHVPVGTTIISGQGTTTLNVTFDNTFALTNSMFTVTAQAPSSCTSAASSLEVLKIVPGIPVAINGPTDACAFIGLGNATYSIDPVPNATSYTWQVTGTDMTLVSGQGSTSIQVSYGVNFTSGNIKVTANSNCGNRAPRSLGVSKLTAAAPLAISGPTNPCAFIGTATQVNYTIAAVLNATSYTWTVPANVTLVSGQGSTSIMVTFNTGYTSGVFKVKSVSNCSVSGDRSLTVTAAAASTPGNISGPANACIYIGTANNATYSIGPVANATSYNWTVPAGASIVSHPAGAGVNDTIITVSFNNSFVGGTNISVQAIACISSSARTLAVSRILPAQPGIITGATNACPFMVSGTNPAGTPVPYSIRKVANVNSYTWTAPSGASITAHPNGAGANDTTIEITYTAGFVSGNVSVIAVNDCGSSTARTLAITKLTPGTPGAITIVNTAPCPNRQYTYTLAAMPTNATSVLWTVPAAGTIVSGQGSLSITVSYTSGIVTGTVTATGTNNCANSSTRSTNISLPACSGKAPVAGRGTTPATVTEAAPMQVNVFPNPTVSDFKLQVVTAGKETIVVRLLDMQGRELKHITVMPYQTINIGAELKPGYYLVEVLQGKNKTTQKLLKF